MLTSIDHTLGFEKIFKVVLLYFLLIQKQNDVTLNFNYGVFMKKIIEKYAESSNYIKF